MNKIEIELGGEIRTLRFGLKVIGDCLSHYDHDAEKFLNALTKNSFQSVPILLYYGLKWDAERDGKIFVPSLATVYDWIEEKGLNNDEISEAIKRFMRSLYENVPVIKEVVDNEDKKKAGFKRNLTGI